MIFQGKWDVPLPKVRAVGEDEVFKVVKTGKTKSKFYDLRILHTFTCFLLFLFCFLFSQYFSLLIIISFLFLYVVVFSNFNFFHFENNYLNVQCDQENLCLFTEVKL